MTRPDALAEVLEHDLLQPGQTDSGLYTRIVQDIRDRAMTTQELADVTGTNRRQITNWATGANKPSGAKRDRLLEVHYLVGLLREVYTREGAEIWLHGRKRSLDGERPIDLLRRGDFPTVLHAVERLRTGAM
jgi:transcriptional regulator with XRE-family HTH domain